jgi:ATP-dependent Clp protease protease subunit
MSTKLDRVKFTAVFALGLLVVILAAGLTVQSVVIWSMALRSSESKLDLVDTLEMFVDHQVEAGFGDSLPDLDDPLLRDRKVLISHAINARSARDTSARLMLLDSQDPTTPIDLYISTQGGWVDSAFTIIDAMRMISAPVNTWAVGGCYSAGALILASGTGTRYATQNALIMIHANQADSEEPFSFERLDLERYERAWQETTELPGDWFPMVFDESYYLTAEEAQEFGLVDRIVPIWERDQHRSESP